MCDNRSGSWKANFERTFVLEDDEEGEPPSAANDDMDQQVES